MTDQPIPRFAKSRPRYSLWAVLALIVAAIILMPIASVVSRVFVPAEDVWAQLIDTVLPLYIQNSVIMVLGVVSLATLIGVATGWLVAAYDFPGRRIFEWALMLPLAMPGYVIAYVYYDRLSYWGADPVGAARSVRMERSGLLVSANRVGSRCDFRAGAGAIPLCLPAGPRGLYGAVTTPYGSCAHIGP